ncbi:MAG TPA: DNA mismatch repair protein MutS [Acetobacteraceae bacterium]|nr:DNA mismatch repair protein MutS [Acetobacteraceae bacterium]
MKAHLLHRDRDFDAKAMPPRHADALSQDLELATLIGAMAGSDRFLAEVAGAALLASLTDPEAIVYRQHVLQDCLANEDVVRGMYALALETIEAERKNYLSSVLRNPAWVLHRSVEVLQMFVASLRRLRGVAEENVTLFRSDGFRTLFRTLIEELGDDYFAAIRRHLKQLRFDRGVLISARLGEGARGMDTVLRRPNPPEGSWIDRVFAPHAPGYSFTLADRDEAGARALSDLRDQGINLVANALGQSTDHILGFFTMLRTELAFYVGCLNLRAVLRQQGAPICFPRPLGGKQRDHEASGLYDICLALTMGRGVVSNGISARDKGLVIITGANQGGKSTFLRSIGLAQVMMQCGMFVGAERFTADVCERIFTHYKREEDTEMNSGKFDEELRRMSDIIDQITPGSLVLFNESFASTNEREGSEIAREVVAALLDRRIKVFFVSHQYEFARAFERSGRSDVLFLRAERREGGTRTFHIGEGRPEPTSHGEDLYRQIFVGLARPAPPADTSARA